MKKINEIWVEMENDDSADMSLLVRRYSTTVLPEVYLGLRKSEKQRCIAVKLKKSPVKNLSRYSSLKDIKLELMELEKQSSGFFLLVILTNAQHQDVFATLCEDLLSGISEITEEEKVVKELLNRLEKWKSLFEKASLQGLSAEEQRGLYGELYFLRKYLNFKPEFKECIHAWVGPDKALRDFQLSGWALEVKTTYGNNHQKIQINSERQLDTTNLKNLFLLHLSLEVQQQHGETLNQIIDVLIKLLKENILAQNQFKSKLLQAGYFIHHRLLYEGLGYQIRTERYYQVKDNFPRIEEHDVRKGIGDVKYSIILSEYTDYLIAENLVFETINNYGE